MLKQEIEKALLKSVGLEGKKQVLLDNLTEILKHKWLSDLLQLRRPPQFDIPPIAYDLWASIPEGAQERPLFTKEEALAFVKEIADQKASGRLLGGSELDQVYLRQVMKEFAPIESYLAAGCMF